MVGENLQKWQTLGESLQKRQTLGESLQKWQTFGKRLQKRQTFGERLQKWHTFVESEEMADFLWESAATWSWLNFKLHLVNYSGNSVFKNEFWLVYSSHRNHLEKISTFFAYVFTRSSLSWAEFVKYGQFLAFWRQYANEIIDLIKTQIFINCQKALSSRDFI